MTETARPDSTARARELGLDMKLTRERANMSGRELSRKLGWTHGKLSHIENGRRPPSGVEVATYLASCGPLVRPDYERMLELAAQPDDAYWVRPHNVELPNELRSLILQESIASSIAQYEPLVVPGLLQTEGYMRALFRWGSRRPAKEIELRIQARLARQGLLKRRFPPECTFFIQEHALRTSVGDILVMGEQLLYLALATSQRRCTIRVVLDSAGPFSTGGAFRLMDYSAHDPVAYTENLASGMFLQKPEDIALYRDFLTRLDGHALDQGQSRAWLANLADAYDCLEAGTPCPPESAPS
ncbi:helix-turn-helix transcriptional regulator [Amycolatopsis sp.]|jgi:transcriptional regulator with XRE-family HTH domain|uniref:helix-turn-helix domain-containing protein n=1 Tax=Amycolatopsis sp. TaxID=37632 RepID=UPI002E095EDD|nr:helix-turn-helix transcriptional regulator [Amycolatopsis sp.]